MMHLLQFSQLNHLDAYAVPVRQFVDTPLEQGIVLALFVD